jgi:hypothetical protein
MYAFHATIHALPTDAAAGPTLNLGGPTFATLSVTPETLAGTSFDSSFEEAAACLARLERMYCEPDGSFVWVSAQAETVWQVDGNLYDRAGRLLFVDVKGTCPQEDFDRLLNCFGWPRRKVMFQLVREAVLLEERAFRRWASTRELVC